MELEILKKKLSSFRSDGGRVTKVSDELLLEILSAWECWTGNARDFYRAIGSNQRKMARMLGKAKKLKREGYGIAFEEVKVEGDTVNPGLSLINSDIEVVEKNKVIRFKRVDLLIEYLKKAA